jgi:hypothetical protein
MWIAIPLVVGSVLLVVVGFIWAARREVLDRAKHIGSLELHAIDALEPNQLNALRARIESETPLTDPATGDSVVFWEASIARDAEVLWSDRNGDRALLDDGNRAVLEINGAELAIESKEIETTYDEPSERMRKMLAEREREIPDIRKGSRWSLVHRAIRVGDEVTVVGVPHMDNSERSVRRGGYRNDSAPTPHFSAANDLLIITREPLATLSTRETADVRSMQWMLSVAAIAGAASLVLGAAIMVLS